ncbi:hypothetical protein V6N11_024531 [Hibiscus sabdariffa]|uniref:Uncharacterized protein n=1 Tax=Hibiscus sabdariffa TaxID=183260 RepID=A0ABR2QMD8_9ROSI
MLHLHFLLTGEGSHEKPSLGVAPGTQEHHGPYGFFGMVVRAPSLDFFRDRNPIMPSLNTVLSHDIHGRLAYLLQLLSDRSLRFGHQRIVMIAGQALRLHVKL